MLCRTCLMFLAAVLAVSCGTTNPDATSVSPTAPSTVVSTPGGAGGVTPSAAAPEKPFQMNGEGRVKTIEWAALPPLSGQTSTFNGRCSVASDYVITFGMVGQATHLGRITGEAQHCSQLAWTPQGPAGATYSDGRFWMEAANGDRLTGTYTDGTSGANENGLWFHDYWTATGGSGRFLNATGGGEEGGSFADFGQLLGGAPITYWMKGTIAYSGSDGR